MELPPLHMPAAKQCTQCLTIKDFDDFGKQSCRKDGKYTKCYDCMRAYRLAYDETHAEKIRLHNAAYNKEHAEKHSLYWQSYRLKNQESITKRMRDYNAKLRKEGRAWDQLHPEESRQLCREWYAANPEKVQSYREKNKEKSNRQAREWRAAHPENNREKCQRRRSRQAGATRIDMSQAQWEEMLKHFQYRCQYCPDNCVECKNKSHDLQQEHITPVTDSGDYSLHNIIPVCGKCNRKKKNKSTIPRPVQPMLLTVAPARKPRMKKDE